jgi:Spy/CpxP family protein refolding chaperone
MIKKRSTFPRLACAAAVIAVLTAAGVSVAAQAGAPLRPDLTGQWQLNRDLSDDAREKLQSMGGGGGDASGGGHGPGRHGGFFGIFGGGRAAHAQLEEVILNAPSRFALTQDDQKVVLTEPNGRVRTLPTNNRKVKVDGRDVQRRRSSFS